MSSSRSVDSNGDVATSVATTDIPSSPMSATNQQRSSSPVVGVTPQNPFDSIVFDTPPIPSLSYSGSGTEASQIHNVKNIISSPPVIGGDSVLPIQGMNSNEQPVSPDRSHVGLPMTPSNTQSPIVSIARQKASVSVAKSDHSVSSGPLIPNTPPIQQLSAPHLQYNPSEQQYSFNDLVGPVSPPQLRNASGAPTAVFIPSSTDQHGRILFDDDENTEPSSAANTTDNIGGSQGLHTDQRQSQQQSVTENVTGSIIRLLQDTRRRMAPKDSRKDSDGDELQSGALISGYLQKYGRNGKWQVRWFETDGEHLSYYKSSKRTKLLATLDLEKVGTIRIDPEDSRECSFTIQVLGRMYHLRADSRTACKDWVITLNRVKEARLQQGNMKLLNHTIDLLDNNGEVTPRVGVVANRQRTRGVDGTIQLDQLCRASDNPADPIHLDNKSLTSLSTQVVARWTKRNTTSLQRLGAKIAQWARNAKKYGCQEVDADNVHLDRHVHPPGHDDSGRHSSIDKIQMNKQVESWTVKESNLPPLAGNLPEHVVLSSGISGPNVGKPSRSLSTTSDDYRTIS